MKQGKSILGLCIASVLWINAHAQSITTAVGGDASGSGGSVSYSVGQIAYQTHTGTNGSVAEGVQQPYEIREILAIEEDGAIHLSLTAYPNPTEDYLTLQVDESEISNLSYRLYDLQGAQLKHGQIAAQQTQIKMSSLPSATYFLYVEDRENKNVRSFKVIKN